MRGLPAKLLVAAMAMFSTLNVASCRSAPASVGPHAVSFQKITLHRDFVCEGASFGDFDGDGHVDVVAGPQWFRGPAFTESHLIYPRQTFDPAGYSNCFFEYPHDFDGDGKLDVLVVGFPGQDAQWYQNPGDGTSLWAAHPVFTGVDNEAPAYVAIAADLPTQLVFMSVGKMGYATPVPNDPYAPWIFHPLSDVRGTYGAFTHGLGVGDVDGDGRPDAIEATGYWTQPASLAGDPVWTRHDQSFGPGGAQMFAKDVDGDGDADIVTTLEAHEHGVAWFEQTTPGVFVEHDIVPDREPLPGDPIIYQPHAIAMADLDGDGKEDIITGERFWGHVPDPPDFTALARIYWFRHTDTAAGVTFVPTLIDDDSGVGTQLTVGDLNGDGRKDIAVANKKGAFIFLQQ